MLNYLCRIYDEDELIEGVEFFPNDLGSLERVLKINRLRGGTAAVFIEPMGPESGTRPLDYDFNAGVRVLCDKYGALLVFDEVVTAFRIGMSGAQGKAVEIANGVGGYHVP